MQGCVLFVEQCWKSKQVTKTNLGGAPFFRIYLCILFTYQTPKYKGYVSSMFQKTEIMFLKMKLYGKQYIQKRIEVHPQIPQNKINLTNVVRQSVKCNIFVQFFNARGFDLGLFAASVAHKAIFTSLKQQNDPDFFLPF